MAVETADDLTSMFADFGVTASYTPVGGSVTSIVGIFDNDYRAVDAGGTMDFAISRPIFTCKTSDVPSAVEGDALVINSIDYIAVVVMDDGTGVTQMMLEAQ